MIPTTQNEAVAAKLARRKRKHNYRRLLIALDQRPLSLSDMADFLFCDSHTAHFYYLAMLRFGVIQKSSQKGISKHPEQTFIPAGDNAKRRRFMAFISACDTVKDEIGHPRRKPEELTILKSQTVVVTKAQNCGMPRDPLVAALFGNPAQKMDQIELF